MEGEIKILNKILKSGKPFDYDALHAKATAIAQEMEILSQQLQDLDLLWEAPFAEKIAFILMNAFFWVFHYKGNTWLPVRSYAIELLKLSPKAILKQYPVSEDFIETFSRFTKRILAVRGICLLKARPSSDEIKKGTYAIRATGAFQHLLEPTKDYLD